MRKRIEIGRKVIAPNEPLFITAEIGVTCNYDVQITKELIDVVKEAGADAVKLIFWFPDEIMSDRSVEYSYDTVDGPQTVNMYEMLKTLRFSLDDWHDIKAYADVRDITLFATVNSPSGIDYADTVGLEAFKLSSWDFNYFPLWRRIARLNKPMLIDTGPVGTLEVAKVMNLMQEAGNDQSVLVHCFHTGNPAEMNMNAIPYMKSAFDTLVGYSSRDQHSEIDIVAVTLGSVYLEKRLTMSRRLPGHHHVISCEPGEFIKYVSMIRNVQSALGVKNLRPSCGDLVERKKWFRQIVADQDIPAGAVLRPDMLEGKRPEAGVSPEFMERFVGRVSKRALKQNEPISWDDV